MKSDIIMVVKREILFSEKYFEGFLPANEFNFESIILSNYEWAERKTAETNLLYKQPIGYSIIFNPLLRQIFFYQRSKKDKKYPEKRLQGKHSCGIGGHITKPDTIISNPIYKSALREIGEEIEIIGKKDMQVLGYINDDSNDVGKVHFGILYLIVVDCESIRPLDPEIVEGKLWPIEKLKKIYHNPNIEMENWTKIALDALEKLNCTF